MSRIYSLDRNLINKIAAGEVIERPASVVKELIENSIDSGSKKITLRLLDGGKKLISVTDDGGGMDAEDLSLAFESHATSKIKTDNDLQKITTLGFRGEALASIASVAHIKATSRLEAAPHASSIEIDCGEKTAVKPASADYGTAIEVRDLFYKLPARRKFLKTTNTEMGHISECFTRFALAYRNIEMRLLHNNRELYHLNADETITQRIQSLFPGEIAENLLQSQVTEKQIAITALMGKPSVSRTNSKFQYVFLNGRYIRDKFIFHAVRQAYRGHIEPGRYPVIFLFIQMPCDDYDVNVHPTKIEVRFYNSNLLHSQILAALRDKLLGSDLEVPARTPALTADSQLPQSRKEIVDAMSEFFKKHRPQAQPTLQFKTHTRCAGAPGENVPQYEKSPFKASQHFEHPLGQRAFIQIHNSFIVAVEEDGFVVIDQHALHERIIYDKLRRRFERGRLESQKLLIPESFELTAQQSETVERHAELLEKLAIEIVPFGPNTWSVQTFPTLLSKMQLVDYVKDLLDLLAEQGPADYQQLLHEVLAMTACKAAIKLGQQLSDEEIGQLLSDKEASSQSSRCPHGRPASIKFSTKELKKQFKRT